MPADAWEPDQYDRFKAERTAPFHDLLALVQSHGHRRVVDLGCGTGRLTRVLHERLDAADTVGVDASPAMLERAAAVAAGHLRFVEADIGALDGTVDGPVDVVFSNAALQWLPDHETVLGGWAELLGPGGQLAVQVPANPDHPSHRLIDEVAAEAPFVDAGDGPPPTDPVRSVLTPVRYAEVLHELGFAEQHVRLQVYGHVLRSTEEVVEWTKGTSLTRMAAHFGPDLYERFVATYRDRLVAELGDRRPFFYPFKRILLWGRR